jgi:Tol biopolymer transport system component
MPTLQPSVGPSLPTPIAILPGEPWLVYASPSGSRTGGGLILARPDGTDRHEILARPDARLDHPDWSRDGSMLAYDSWSPDGVNPDLDRIDIWIADADGANARQVTSCESPCLQRSWAAWSPDGSNLAMIRYDLAPDRTWGPSAIEILEIATGDIRVVSETADGLTSYYTPRWSPDASRIVFGLETYTDASQSTLITSSLAVIDANGTDASPVSLTPPDLEARYPDWHPADDRIVFQARRPALGASTTDLYVIDADGSALTNLTGFGGRDRGAEMPTWAPDGLRIWYSQQSGRPYKAAASMAGDGSDRLVVNLDLAATPRLRPTP